MPYLDRDSLTKAIRAEEWIDGDTHSEFVRGVAHVVALLTPMHPADNDTSDAIESAVRALTASTSTKQPDTVTIPRELAEQAHGVLRAFIGTYGTQEDETGSEKYPTDGDVLDALWGAL